MATCNVIYLLPIRSVNNTCVCVLAINDHQDQQNCIEHTVQPWYKDNL
jgi:hypothetical protein